MAKQNPTAAWCRRQTTRVALIAPAALAACLPARLCAQTATAAVDAPPTVDEVIVTGTRLSNRTQYDSPVPVDVLGSDALQRSGQTNVFDAVNALVPSFEIPAEGGDISRLIRSARLDGLSPDDTLVLIDGKRRHVSAMINSDVGPVFGSDPVDLDMIPASMIDHIEILRQGAAAQYGSDATAGVVNIITKKNRSGGDAYAQEGAYYYGDGFSNSLGANSGLPLGEAGYLNLSLDYRYHDHSNRCGLDPRAAQYGITSNPCRTAGDPKFNIVNFGFSAGEDFGGATLYSTGTYGYRNAIGYNGWRTPTKFKSPWYQENYPDGYVPSENLQENDFGVTVGIKGTLGGQWKWDLSTTYGGDFDKIFNVDDLNSSLVTNTGYLIDPVPASSYAGGYDFTEWTNNLDVSRLVDTGIFATPLNVAFGAEFRRDDWQLNPGSYASSFGSGASAFPGFTQGDATSVHRENTAAYIDFAADVVQHWQVDLAGRFEHYSDFGSTQIGKFSTRYDFTPQFALRGTVANGFRAPTLTQEFQTELNVGPVEATGQLPASSRAAIALGAVPLKPEKSRNYSAGMELTPLVNLHIGLDLYLIDIKDQIEDSGLIGAALQTNPAAYYTAVAALRQAGFNIDPSASEVFAQFYTNGIATRTRGADLTVDYQTNGPWDGRMDWTLAANVNSVKLTHVSTFANGATQFTPDVLSEITQDSPKNKIVLQANYRVRGWDLTARETRWGTTAEVMADQNLGPPFYYTNTITPTYTTDLRIAYALGRGFEISAGVINAFNVYPNKTVYQTRDVSNTAVYPPNSPFGFDGGTYYGRLEYRW